jgi:hypothetical protein
LRYVDDCLFFCHDEKKINNLIADLNTTFNLTEEGDVAAYLGVNVNKATENGQA